MYIYTYNLYICRCNASASRPRRRDRVCWRACVWTRTHTRLVCRPARGPWDVCCMTTMTGMALGRPRPAPSRQGSQGRSASCRGCRGGRMPAPRLTDAVPRDVSQDRVPRPVTLPSEGGGAQQAPCHAPSPEAPRTCGGARRRQCIGRQARLERLGPACHTGDPCQVAEGAGDRQVQHTSIYVYGAKSDDPPHARGVAPTYICILYIHIYM